MDSKVQDETQKDPSLLAELADVYNFIKASEQTKTISGYSLKDYIGKAIKEIEGPTDNNRPDKLKRLDQVEASLNDLVQRLS